MATSPPPRPCHTFRYRYPHVRHAPRSDGRGCRLSTQQLLPGNAAENERPCRRRRRRPRTRQTSICSRGINPNVYVPSSLMSLRAFDANPAGVRCPRPIAQLNLGTGCFRDPPKVASPHVTSNGRTAVFAWRHTSTGGNGKQKRGRVAHLNFVQLLIWT